MAPDIAPQGAIGCAPDHRISDRTPCLVPFCGRTMARERLNARGDVEWICGPHWRAVPPRARAVYRRARAAERRAAAAASAVGRTRRLWLVCKRHAIEAAGGIA